MDKNFEKRLKLMFLDALIEGTNIRLLKLYYYLRMKGTDNRLLKLYYYLRMRGFELCLKLKTKNMIKKP